MIRVVSKRELEKQVICADCVGDRYLKEQIGSKTSVTECRYCKKSGHTTTVGDMADRIHTVVQHYYVRADGRHSIFADVLRSGARVSAHESESVVDMVSRLAQVDAIVAEDIRRVLAGQHTGSEFDNRLGCPPFSADARYSSRTAGGTRYHTEWRQFEEQIQTESRFFHQGRESALRNAFQDLLENDLSSDNRLVVDAGPGTTLPFLFRARVFQDSKKLEEALKSPAVKIGPPPAKRATAGRMNAHGIAVFYGSTEACVAVAEVRPPVGSHVVVGRFEILREIRLLNVEGLKLDDVPGSRFDPAYRDRLDRQQFLESLAERISRPVMPDDEPLEYLATQAIADYLASQSTPKIDGILYPSVQQAGDGANVVLFHRAARVQGSVGTEPVLRVLLPDEGGPLEAHLVVGQAPQSAAASDIRALAETWETVASLGKGEERTVGLRLDDNDITLHRVRGVHYDTSPISVRRIPIRGSQPDSS